MARISLNPPRTLLYRLAEWYARRSYGTVPDPLRALAPSQARSASSDNAPR